PTCGSFTQFSYQRDLELAPRLSHPSSSALFHSLSLTSLRTSSGTLTERLPASPAVGTRSPEAQALDRLRGERAKPGRSSSLSGNRPRTRRRTESLASPVRGVPPHLTAQRRRAPTLRRPSVDRLRNRVR